MRSSATIFLAAIAAFISFEVQDREQDSTESENKEKIEVLVDGPDAITRRDFMRTKLLYSKNIFEGLTTGNFDLIKTGVKEVRSVTDGERWIEIDDDRYRKLTEDFKTTTSRLADAVETKNIDAIALRYYQMSTSCIDCHKHIRKVGYEF